MIHIHAFLLESHYTTKIRPKTINIGLGGDRGGTLINQADGSKALNLDRVANGGVAFSQFQASPCGISLQGLGL